ncbi:MAG: hypothetical protein M1161_00185 [Candidatus Thermoplasmatota archaeon]|jgi:hypothetical protein|nr:hypothetical protein [Candidatus Thermoplasmatota archaeon]
MRNKVSGVLYKKELSEKEIQKIYPELVQLFSRYNVKIFRGFLSIRRKKTFLSISASGYDDDLEEELENRNWGSFTNFEGSSTRYQLYPRFFNA